MGWASVLALILTALSMLVKLQHCSCGPGWGFPFQPYHVVCGEKCGDVFAWSWIAFLLNLAFWFVVGMPIGLVIEFLVERKGNMKEPAEPAPPPYSEPAARTPQG